MGKETEWRRNGGNEEGRENRGGGGETETEGRRGEEREGKETRTKGGMSVNVGEEKRRYSETEADGERMESEKWR